METFAERLKHTREQLGITQDALAKAVDRRKSQSIIANLESGANKSSTYLPEIAHILGVDAYWLKTGKGQKSTNTVSPGVMQEVALYEFKAQDDEVTAEIIAIARRLDSVGKGMLLAKARDFDQERAKCGKANTA